MLFLFSFLSLVKNDLEKVFNYLQNPVKTLKMYKMLIDDNSEPAAPCSSPFVLPTRLLTR